MKKYIFFITTSIFFISACCNKDGIETARYELTDAELELIPYKSGDRISFVHSNGYEFEMYVTEKTTEWNEYHAFCEWNCCGQDYYSYQTNKAVLNSANPTFGITIQQGAMNGYSNYYFPGALNIGIIGDGSTQFLYDSLANFICDTLVNCYDTIELNNKKYYNVLEKELNTSFAENDTSLVFIKSILYNKNYGLLQLKISNNETYTIK